MVLLSPSATIPLAKRLSFYPKKTLPLTSTFSPKLFEIFGSSLKTNNFNTKKRNTNRFCSSIRSSITPTAETTSTSSFSSSASTAAANCSHWLVVMETPPPGITSKQEIINYYVKTLEGVLGRFVCYQPTTFNVFNKFEYYFYQRSTVAYMPIQLFPFFAFGKEKLGQRELPEFKFHPVLLFHRQPKGG